MALTSRIKVKNRIFQGGSRYRRERNRTHFTFARSSIGLVNPMRYASSGVLFSGAGVGDVIVAESSGARIGAVKKLPKGHQRG